MSPTYTLRRCWPDNPDSQDDYQFCCDGVPVGRCYFMEAAMRRPVWRWTVYNVSGGDMEDTLEEAKAKFKAAFEAAGGPAKVAEELKRKKVLTDVQPI